MISLTIDGVEKSQLINWESIVREQVLSKEPDSLSFLIKKHDGQTYKPVVGDEVVLTVGASKEFGGFIIEIEESTEARVEYIRIICKDYTHELDRQLVSKTYANQSINDIISDLITTFATGITDTNVNCPTVIESVTFNYITVSKCLERLTDLVDGYEWYIDYDKDIHFFLTDNESSPFNLSDTSGNYIYNSLVIRQDTHQLRNEVLIRGGLLTSETIRTEIVTSDSSKKVFPLATKFANVPAVTVNSSSVTVGIENLDLPSAYTCLWNYNEKSLVFASSPATGTIGVTEYPQYPLILQKRDEESIMAYGLFQSVIVDKNIRDLETAGLRADVELLKYSQPEKTANFTTYTSGLRTGQTINIQSDIRGIDNDFKIQSIKSKLRTPDTDEMVYSIESITAEDLGINDILAMLLIKNPSDQIDIQADEFVERIRQFKEVLFVGDSSPTVSTTVGPYYWGGTTSVWGFSVWNA